MTFGLGFSWVGLLFSAAMFAPSLLLLGWPPVDAAPSLPAPPPRWVIALEGVGRVTCLVIPVITTSFAGQVDVWFALATGCYGVYLGLWGRYLARGRCEAMLVRAWAGVPIPLAVFPVLTFASAAAWARSPALAVATGALAVGHLTGSWIRSRGWAALRSAGSAS